MLFGGSDIKLTRVRVELTSETLLIWIGLICAGAIVLMMFGLIAHQQHHSPDGRRVSKNERRELEAIAGKAFQRAQQAAHASAEADAQLAQAESEREQAWQAHTEANNVLGKANSELESVPREPMPRSDQSAVARAARDAYRRGELTEEQLRAVWEKVGGWGDALQAKTSELSILRVEVSDAWRRYQLASTAVRLARQRAEIAQVAARALKEEAVDAARDAELARKKRR
jgi:hypothetical protein